MKFPKLKFTWERLALVILGVICIYLGSGVMSRTMFLEKANEKIQHLEAEKEELLIKADVQKGIELEYSVTAFEEENGWTRHSDLNPIVRFFIPTESDPNKLITQTVMLGRQFGDGELKWLHPRIIDNGGIEYPDWIIPYPDEISPFIKVSKDGNLSYASDTSNQVFVTIPVNTEFVVVSEEFIRGNKYAIPIRRFTIVEFEGERKLYEMIRPSYFTKALTNLNAQTTEWLCEQECKTKTR